MFIVYAKRVIFEKCSLGIVKIKLVDCKYHSMTYIQENTVVRLFYSMVQEVHGLSVILYDIYGVETN